MEAPKSGQQWNVHHVFYVNLMHLKAKKNYRGKGTKKCKSTQSHSFHILCKLWYTITEPINNELSQCLCNGKLASHLMADHYKHQTSKQLVFL